MFFFLMFGFKISSAQKVSLNFNQKSLKTVLESISVQTGYMLAYSKEEVNLEKPITIRVTNAELTQVLDELLRPQNIDYEIKDNKIYLFTRVIKKTINAMPRVQQTQQVQIIGKVTNTLGEPIPGVTVLAKGTTIRTLTNIDGVFSIRIPADVEMLQFSFVGMKMQEAPIAGQTTINVVMEEEAIGLEEVVVVGYGMQKKETVTGAITTIRTREILEAPVANISNALVGRMAGVLSTQASGEPGRNAATIRIRGVGTLNSEGQEPLVIIDGIQSSFSIMNAMDPNEIESISILKDVSATAIYGVKGANGVIIVTTRRGEAGKPQINFSANFGMTELATKLRMLNSYEYALFRNEAIKNDNDPTFNRLLFTDDELWKFQNNRDYTPDEVKIMNLTDAQKEALLASPALYYTSHDYFEEQFGELSPQQQYNLNISGGIEGMRYFTSIGYFSQKGVFKNADYGDADVNSLYERYNLRSNFDIDLAKTLKINIDMSGQFITNGGILGAPQDGAVTSEYARRKAMLVNILSSPPFASPGIVDGHLIVNSVNNPIQSKGATGFSPVAYLLTRPYLTSHSSNLNTKIKLIHEMDYLTKGLSLSGTVSYNGNYTKGIYRQNSIPQYTITRNPLDPVEVLFFGGSIGPITVLDNYNNYKWRQLYLEGALNYNNAFGKHSLTGLLLYNAQKTFDPVLLYNVPAGLIGLVGRAAYNYNGRYLAEFNFGYNGSENFPENKRFGFFPAISVGWVITNEKFFPQTNIVTWLKLRASYGEVGNDKIGGRRFLYLPSTWGYGGQYAYGGYYFGDSHGENRDPFFIGATEHTVGNPDVTWERARKVNVGLEANFIKNKLSFIGDIFNEKRDNILWARGSVPGIVGADLPPANIGKVSNWGYELQLSWKDKIGNVKYGIRGNLTYAKNKIEYMDEPEHPYEWMNATGYSIGQYKGLVADGFYNTKEEVANHPYSTIDGNKVQVGDLRYKDINGDGMLDSKDYIPIGYSNLPRYAFGTTLSLQYKGFSLSVLFTGTAKGSFLMTDFYLRNPFYQNTGAAMKFQYDGRWTPEKAVQGIEPTFPRASLRTYSTISGVTSDFWVKSTNHIRLKNLEIGYTFTNLRALKKAGVNGLRLYANGNNLFTWSNLPDGIDPEQQDSGGAGAGYLYPLTRVYNIGFQIQFQ